MSLPISDQKEEFDSTTESYNSSYITTADIVALGHLRSLDGLRGIAVTLVMLDHIMSTSPTNRILGSIGVTIFFTLSGFLITGILLEAQSKNRRNLSISSTKYSHLTGFWSARVVRLFPALFVVVGTGTVLAYNRGKEISALMSHAIRALFSLENTPYLLDKHTTSFEFSWSLACEEQFYFLWCFTLIFIAPQKRRTQQILVFSAIIISISIRLFAGIFPSVHWSLKWNRALIPALYKMLSGSMIRLIHIPRWTIKRSAIYIGLSLYTLAIYWAYMCIEDNLRIITLFTDMLAVTGTLFIIIGSLYHQNQILDAFIFQFIGRISYGTYMWTSMLVTFRRTMFKGYPAVADTAVGLICAASSTFFLEEPIRTLYRDRLKRKSTLPV